MSDPPPLSIVVPTKDRVHLLEGCLDALHRSVRPNDEVIVADSASCDDRTKAEAVKRGISYVRCDTPGVSIARNAGWRAAVNDLVAFVDDDIRVDERWAESIASAFATLPDAAFVTGMISLPPNVYPERPIALKEGDDPAWLGRSTQGVIGHSANLAVRKSVLEQIGGFDERFGAGGLFLSAEDLDLFDRMFAAGLRGRYEPSAAATHVHWRRRRDIARLEWSYGVGGGARIANLVRTDRLRAMTEARKHLWTAGFVAAWNSLQTHHLFLSATRLLRAAGVLIGIAWATWELRRRPRTVGVDG